MPARLRAELLVRHVTGRCRPWPGEDAAGDEIRIVALTQTLRDSPGVVAVALLLEVQALDGDAAVDPEHFDYPVYAPEEGIDEVSGVAHDLRLEVESLLFLKPAEFPAELSRDTVQLSPISSRAVR